MHKHKAQRRTAGENEGKEIEKSKPTQQTGVQQRSVFVTSADREAHTINSGRGSARQSEHQQQTFSARGANADRGSTGSGQTHTHVVDVDVDHDAHTRASVDIPTVSLASGLRDSASP